MNSTFGSARHWGMGIPALLVTMSMAAGIGNAQTPAPVTKPNLLSNPAPPVVPVPPLAPGLSPVPGQALGNDAHQVRDQLNGLFEQYPPSVREVLQLDPSLVGNANYLALYPALAAFVAQHPEIVHNPAYFVGTRANFMDRRPTTGDSIASALEPIAIGSVFIVMICTLGWIIRSIMTHRRWLRVSRLQSDMQNKLLERFTSNEEMLAFIQTAAGQRFLESASLSLESGPRALSAPVGRMLWSIQLGIVMVVAGTGLAIIGSQLSNYGDAVTGFRVAGEIVMTLGVGFILSAFGSYLLSRRMGLLEPSSPPSIP